MASDCKGLKVGEENFFSVFFLFPSFFLLFLIWRAAGGNSAEAKRLAVTEGRRGKWRRRGRDEKKTQRLRRRMRPSKAVRLIISPVSRRTLRSPPLRLPTSKPPSCMAEASS